MPKQVLHYPRMDTILNVERIIKNAEEPLSKNEIDRRLEKKIMRPTLNTILDYLEKSGKIAISKGGIVWIYNHDIISKLRLRLEEGIETKSRQTKMKNDLKKIKSKIAKILKKNDVVKASLFGSYARGDAKRDSDIDILIKFKGQKSLFDLVRLERNLKEQLKKNVNLLTYNSINPLLKEKISKEEVKII